jgi:hypothetical protein
MTLRALFAIPIAVILLVTLSLAGMITGQTWSGLERGRAAVSAVERMRILLLLDGNLATERIMTNVALAASWPLTEASAARLATAKKETDERIEGLRANLNFSAATLGSPARPPPDLVELLIKLGTARAATYALLAADHPTRSFEALNALVSRMLAVSYALLGPMASASLDVIAADPSLSGFLAMARIATSLRDEVSRVAWIIMPRFNKGEQMTQMEIAEVHRRLAVASELTRTVARIMEVTGPTDPMQQAIAALLDWDNSGELRKLGEVMLVGPYHAGPQASILPPQQTLIPWGNRIAALRIAMLDALVGRVTQVQVEREARLNTVIAAFGAVLFAVLTSVLLLRFRVFRPLAQLGEAITRIADGDRTSPLVMRSATREIAGMVTAVETLRQAALVADDAALRQRLAARQRLEMLHEALGIAQTVREPGRALERGVASLSEGIDATIALATTATTAPPATLGVAADAVRVGLAEMRDSFEEFEATFVAARKAQAEDPPEEEFVARILAVQVQVERRDETVRAFITPSLVALRDTASANGEAPGQMVRDLVSDQFQRVEATVAILASMHDAVTRATAIVRGLPMEAGKIAA